MFAVEETYQTTWPILSRKLPASVGLDHNFAEFLVHVLLSASLALCRTSHRASFQSSLITFSEKTGGELSDKEPREHL